MERAAVFVLPTTTAGQQGPVASWVSTAGWASAAARVLGSSWIVTPSGVTDPTTARRRASEPTLAAPVEATWRRRLPTVLKTAFKDARQLRRARAFEMPLERPWSDASLAFVWQRHELFCQAGLDLAAELGTPAVLFVPAPLVWEAGEWGVHRPGWQGWLERHGEQPSLLRADLVACGSERVVDEVRRLGVGPDRILVTPTGVDLEMFAEGDRGDVRSELGLDEQFVVGWVGSFRAFHAVERLVDALVGIEGATLLLVGDGPQRPAVEARITERGVRARLTGTVPHHELGRYLAAMDVGVVTGDSRRGAFHYSPLKLAEYLASGLAVVAPAEPQIEARLTDGVDAVIVARGDVPALRAALEQLRDDPRRREALGAAGRVRATAEWSWDHQVLRVLDALSS